MSQPPILEKPEIAAAPASENPKSWQRILHSKGAMLAMLFCVTGALGIPFLWKSQAFGVAEKVFWSIAVSIYTSLLLWGTAAILTWSYRNISNALVW